MWGMEYSRSTRSSARTASSSPSRTRIPFSGATTSVAAPSLPAMRASDLALLHEVAGGGEHLGAGREPELGVVLLDARDLDLRADVAADDLDDPVDVADLGLALGDAGLEELLDARQAGRDVGAAGGRDAAGVERPHRQLRARLADRLGGDDADRLADAHERTRWRGCGRSSRRQTPLRDSQVSGERTRTSRMPASSIGPGGDLADLLGAIAEDLAVGAGDRRRPRSGRRAAGRTRRAPGVTSSDSARVIQLPSSVPQSSSRVITSWATSTRRRVR